MYEHERHERRPREVPNYCTVMPPRTEALLPNMRQYLENRSLSMEIAEHNLWYPTYYAGDLQNIPRVVMPATSRIASNAYWQARSMLDDNAAPRYQSPPCSRGDALIVCWPMAKPTSAVLTEGPMDALAAATASALGIALMGNTPNELVLAHVRALVGRMPLRIVADNDAPAALAKLMSRLVGQGFRGPIDVVLPYPAKDLAEATLEERQRIVWGGRYPIQ